MTDRFVIDCETMRVQSRHAFGIKDARGREIGAIVTTWCERYRPWREGDHGFCWDVEAGVDYRIVNVHATRDGKPYGALQHDRRFRTDNEADAYVLKYLDDAKKRAAKISKK